MNALLRGAESGMPFFLIFVLGPWFAPSASARPTDPDSAASAQKYWVFLEDRPQASPSSPKDRWTLPVAPSYLRRLRAVGVRPQVRSRWFHAVSAALSPSTRRRVQRLSFVEEIRPVLSYGIPTTASDKQRAFSPIGSRSPPDSLLLGPSGRVLARINARAPLRRGLGGHGIRVGFLDANFGGLDHPAFSSMRAEGRVAALRNFTSRRQSGAHGAGVVSVAAGSAPGRVIGPAHAATVLGATTEYTSFERNVEEDHFVAGLEWLSRKGVSVVNVSIGYTRFDEGETSYTPSNLDGDTALTTRAVDRAAQLGIAVVVSAGNSGCAHPDSCWFYLNTPADADSAIAVGAIRPDSTLASFSARGPTADGRRKPDVVVQGKNVVAAWSQDRYVRVSGTSFASPQVTGIVAQMLQVNPQLSPMQVRDILRGTASQSARPDSTRGWGIVNADAAIRTAEWQARKAPPAALTVSTPYRDGSRIIFPLSVPSQTSTLRFSLYTPMGQRVRQLKRSLHAGPNRIGLNVKKLPPGTYRYKFRTDGPEIRSGTISVPLR